ncbi:Na+/H+ antiporter subunit E [Aestuariibius sp. 2305UL40-4]|uniref:Na+/H+ antiporter subunit E n=1 Tax=Aestuariibius violaceus TaxID=3234132 RepID=UPI00345E4504
MNKFVTNLLLAGCWAALSGSFSVFSLLVGFVLGFLILWLLQPLIGGAPGYFLRTYHWIRLIVMFHYELIVSSLSVVWDIVTPRHRAKPDVIEVPLDVTTDAGILLVTNLISLTPGTLSLDVAPDRKTLLVHAMFAEDPDKIRNDLKNGMERWVKEAVET